MASAFETARLAANLFGSAVDGVALAPAHSEIVAADPMVAVSFQSEVSEAELCRRARQSFDAYAAQHAQGGEAG